ncbi:hypothetical protein FMUND_14375 [Fusarium mundagurra]|uniref:Uncharacterized protein n=1 Tax=Fusarium mundagurra TaxID=1567541 RepID=A0A8H5XUI1_9HYPO|nr:hypothetical protein FMUND_14375 [Fusarium mundagurra]
MSDTPNPSTQSNENDDDLISLFDTFYDAPGSPSPEPAMSPIQSQQQCSNANDNIAGIENIATDLDTIAADFQFLKVGSEALAIHAETSGINLEACAIDKRLLDRAETAVEQAQAAHQTSTNVVVYILGKDRLLKILRVARDNHIPETGNDINTSSVNEAGPAAEWRQSSPNEDDVKCDRHAYIRNAEKHHTNTLSLDTDISIPIHDALLDEK